MDHVYPTTTRGYNNGVVTTVSNSCSGSGGMGMMSNMNIGVHDAHMNGLSLQEMIDSDMKEEFDDVMRDHGLGFGNIDSLDLLGDLDSLDSPFKFDTSGHSISNGWLPPAPQNSNNANNGGNDNFVSSYLEDLNCASTVMVNPNNVMPVMSAQQRHQQHQPMDVSSAPVAAIFNNSSVPTVAYVQQQSEPSYGQQQIHTQSFVLARGPATKTLKVLPPVSSPLQRVPSSPSAMTMTMDMSSVVVGAAAASGVVKTGLNGNAIKKKVKTVSGSSVASEKENAGGYPKPAYSYSCLIALALKNSESGSMSVSEIYKFMCENFPYFKTAPTGWKNSVRHNLSLNKCFEKIEKPVTNGNQRKGCLWTMNPAKVNKMDEEVQKWSRKDKIGIMKSMVMPETLESLERGDLAKDYNANTSSAAGSAVAMRHASVESGDEDDPRTPASVSSQGSQGYDSGSSDFVDIENFAAIIPDSSLPELNLQATGGIYEDLGEDRLRFSATPTNGGGVVSVERVGDAYYQTQTVNAHYAIAPASSSAAANGKKCNTLVVHRHEGVQKIFSV